MSEAKAPDYTAPILGVREWIVQGKYLGSTSRSEIWNPGEEKTATCQQNAYTITYSYWPTGGGDKVETHLEPAQPPPGHNPPADGCGCGLYAYYDRKYSEAYGDNLSKAGMDSGVRGVVSAWGDVILCDYGFKAQHMKLEAIFLEEKTIKVFGSPVSIEAAYRRLAERYSVPLILPAEFKAFSKEVGGIVLSPPETPKKTSEISVSFNQAPSGWQVGFPSFVSGPIVSGQSPLASRCNCLGCQIFDRRQSQSQTTYKEWRDKTKDIRERRS